MKIVFVNSSGQIGGAERVLLDLLASLGAAEPSWTLHLVVPSEGTLAASARTLGVGVTALAQPRSLSRLGDAGAGGPAGAEVGRLALARRMLAASMPAARHALRLRRVLKCLAPDIVHANGFKAQLLAAWSRPACVPVAWHVHDFVSSRPVASRLLRLSSRHCAVAVANSLSVAGDARRALGGRVEVRTIHNAVDIESFSPAGTAVDLDALAGLPRAEEGTVRVGLVATLARWKGHRTFLEALSLVPASARVRGYVVGGALYETDGSQHRLEELRRAAREFGVAGRVGFTGFVADAPGVFRALDVAVHASTAPEPFGLVIAEAMACGRAVVASRAGGAREIVTEGRDALAHAPGDAAELALRITELASDPGLRVSLGRRARETAVRRFDRARLAAQWTRVYRALMRGEEISKRVNGLRNKEAGALNDELEAS
ncbi:MAG TPA: glycosyltransferase family 4 protein [Pyrinomonadaceae bacterium]|nr:glycosyltransferase family 4 protein [Pyrinomonadaceae bacterium]